jgi:hypothetical protein
MFKIWKRETRIASMVTSKAYIYFLKKRKYATAEQSTESGIKKYWIPHKYYEQYS